MIREGVEVDYAGPPGPAFGPACPGVLLAVSGNHGHVQWSAGSRAGQTDLVPLEWLTPRASALVADALDLPEELTASTVRESVADGELVDRLAAAGVLDSLADICEEIRSFAAQRVRAAPELAPVLGALGPEEADEIVEMASAAIIRNTARSEEGR